MKVFTKKQCTSIFISIVCLIIVGSFFDYQISQAVFYPDSFIGMICASYGQLPAMLCMSIAGVLLIRMCQYQHKIIKMIFYLSCLVLHVFAIMGIAMDPMLYIKDMSIALSVVIAFVIVGCVDFLVFKYTKNTDREAIKKFIILILLVMFLEIVIINIIKIPWSRPRMRMISTQSEATFQPWWVIGCENRDYLLSIGVLKEEFKSFPSGHTGNAACALLLGMLPMIISCLKGKENVLFYLGIIFTIIIAVSRIVMGAHFLTDVTIGMGVTFMIEVVMVFIIYRKKGS